jgi:ABC-type branched-subunit amino acid transport system substrate-binding protein
MNRRTVLTAIAASAAWGLPGRGAAQGAAAYKIGVTFPLTGPLASVANEFIPGAQVAVDEINRKGGVKGHRLQLVAEDSQGTPQGGIAAMRKLVDVDGVQAIITIYTNVVTAQMPLADQLHVPTMSNILTANLVSKSQYSFVHQMRVSSVSAVLQNYWREHRVKKIYVIFPDNGFGQQNTPGAKAMVEGAGSEFGVGYLDFTTQDYRGFVARLRDFAPDAIYVNAQGGQAETTAIRQIRELGITVPMYELAVFYQAHNWRVGVGPYAEGMYFAGVAVPPGTAHDFIVSYRAKTGFDPDYNAAELYDMIYMYARAIEMTSYRGEDIRGALATMHGVPSSLGGTITMAADHYTNISNVRLWRVRSGRLVAVA